MGKLITIGRPVVLGTGDTPLPLKGFPAGRYRVRLRSNEFAFVYVKTVTGIRQFTIEIEDGYWVPGFEVGRNIRG